MQGFQTAAHRLAQLPDNPQRLADGGSVAFGSRGLSGLRDLIPKMESMGFKQAQTSQPPAAAPAEASGAAGLRAMIPRMEAMGYKQAPQYLAKGGLVHGPGTGTSDSIATEAEPGTFIMPADSTKEFGPSALEQMSTVPVRLSHGEFAFAPEQVMGIGAAVLKLMKDATHEPVNGEDGGQTDADVGVMPTDRLAEMPQFADGGLVQSDITRVGNSYSGGNVGGDVSINGQAGGGTVSTTSWTAPVPSTSTPPTPAPAPAPAASAAAPAVNQATAAPPTPAAPAPMGWAERNAQRNNQVTASSMVDSPERRAAQAALAPAPAPVAATSPVPPVGGFQPAAQRMGTLPAIGQPRRYADGGVVGNEDRAVFGFYPQLAAGSRSNPATDQQLRSGVVATGPSTFEPAVTPAPAATPPATGGGDGRRMNADQDPRSLSYSGEQAPAAQTQSDGALGRAASLMSAPPRGPSPTPQNAAAAESLALRGAADAMATMPSSPQLSVQAPTVRHSGNDWAARNALRNAEVSASSITNDRRWGGEGEKSADRMAYQRALATDSALQAAEPTMAEAAMRETGANNRAAFHERGAASRERASQMGLLDRTLITERGNNTRAGITAQANVEAAQANVEAARVKSDAAGAKPLNDVQSKALQFGSRMQTAGGELDKLAAAGVSQPGLIKRGADAVGLGAAANWTQSGAQQQVEQAQRDFINAVLRRESGAAIADSEFSNARQQYFPQPGDTPEVIAQKRKNRDIATAGVLAEVPDSEKRVNQVLTQANANAPAPSAAPAAMPSGMSRQVGTSGGKPVFEDAQGRRFIGG